MPEAAPRRQRIRLVITGRVQGVYFRESTRQQAEALGVSGWVRNLPDGRVEALLDGPADAVAALRRWCQRGPPSAEVASLQEFPAEADAPIEPGFRVLR